MLLNMSHYININVCTKPRRSPRGLCTDEGHLCSVPPYRLHDELKSVRYENPDGSFEIRNTKFKFRDSISLNLRIKS